MRPFDDRTEPKSRTMTLETLSDQKNRRNKHNKARTNREKQQKILDHGREKSE